MSDQHPLEVARYLRNLWDPELLDAQTLMCAAMLGHVVGISGKDLPGWPGQALGAWSKAVGPLRFGHGLSLIRSEGLTWQVAAALEGYEEADVPDAFRRVRMRRTAARIARLEGLISVEYDRWAECVYEAAGSSEC